MPELQRSLSLLGLLYDAALEPNKWHLFFSELCELFSSDYGQVFKFDHKINKPKICTFTSVYNLDMRDFSKWNHLLQSDPRNPERFLTKGYDGYPKGTDVKKIYSDYMQGKALHCRLFVTDEALHQSEMYKKVLFPNNIEYSMTLRYVIPEEKGATIDLALMRSRERQPFTLEDCKKFDLIGEHVIRALKIQSQLIRLDNQTRTASKILNNIQLGIILLDPNCQTLFVNQYAEDILKKNEGIVTKNQQIKFDDNLTKNKFEQLFESLLNDVKSNGDVSGCAMSILRNSEKRPYSLLLSRQENNFIKYTSDCSDYTIITLFIHDPDKGINTQASLLRELYQLTKTESLVLECLVQGENVKQIAQIMQVQDNTVRKHLKNIYSKTDTSSQAELIQQVLSNPIWLGTHAFSVN